LHFFLHDGSACSLARRDQTDVGISSALPLALAFSVVPMLLLLTRLAVRSARREPGEHTAFPCSTTIIDRDDLGPRSTPAVLHSRRAIKQNPNLTAYRFGRSLEQSLVASQL